MKIFKLILLPLVSVTIFLFIKTPSLSEISFSTSSNFDTSGGFGPNQVSTIFGVGIFVLGATLLLGLRQFKYLYIDLILFVVFIFRDMITFSRGGLFTAVLAIVPVYFLGTVSRSNREKGLKILYVILVTFAFALMFNYLNKATGNNLANRYKGKTIGTISGDKAENIETLSDHRSAIIEEELKVFSENIFFGIGPGQQNYYLFGRWERNSHTEFSRLLAEHGLLGLIICILLIVPFFRIWNTRYFLMANNYAYFLNLGFLLFAVSLSFHASMRTIATPFLFGLGFAGLKLKNDFIEIIN